MVFLNHLLFAGRNADAVAETRRALQTMPQLATNAHEVLARALWRLGRYDEAMAEWQQVHQASDPGFRAMQAAYARSGPEAALKARSEVMKERAAAVGRRGAQPVNPLDVASACAEAGDADCAFKWLEVAYGARVPQILHVVANPSFDRVRGDPRHADLLRRLGLPITGT
jgi:tetratricopeptide (TPR) repeat protein